MSKYTGNLVTADASSGYSVYFDGSGDSLTLANNANLDLSTGDFTVECWFYILSAAANSPLIFRFNGNATSRSNLQYVITYTSAGNLILSPYQGTAVLDITFTGVTINQWHHCALVRTGNIVYGFLDGVRNSTSQTVTTLNTGTWLTYIGNYQESSVNQWCNGFISNVRIVKGTALYTGATYSPPAQLLNIPNTSLLTCNSPSIVDQSSNAFAITVNGNAAVSTVTPFTGYQSYNPALGAATSGVWTLSEAMQATQSRQWNMYDPYFDFVTLRLTGNGTNGSQNNTFIDSSSNAFSITRNGNSTQGSFSPFSPTGWASYFNGSNNYLEVPNSTQLQFGSGAFTFEAWINPENASGSTGLMAGMYSGPSNSGGQFGWFYDGTNQRYVFQWLQGGAWQIYNSSTNAVPRNTWTHIAATYNGTNTLRLFVNGSLLNVFTVTITMDTPTYAMRVGLSMHPSFPNPYKGWISNMRIVKGLAVYTSPFTPSIAPLGATSGGQFPPTGTQTSALILQSNRYVDNSTFNATVTNFNSTPIYANGPFSPLLPYSPSIHGGSAYYDGTGDSINTAQQTAFAFGTGNFTVEGWVYFTFLDASAANCVVAVANGQNSTAWNIYATTGGWGVRSHTANVFGTLAAPRINTWNHFAWVRNGSTNTFYVNGTSIGTATNSTNWTDSQFWSGSSPIGGAMRGYVSGVRLLKGTALYTSNFTPPTIPPSDITNTSILLNFTNGGIVDYASKNAVETIGNAQISTVQNKYGSGSLYFDGNGDYLSFASSPLLNVTGGIPFTVECWVYTGSSSRQNIFIFTLSGGYWDLCVTGYAVNLRYNNAAVSLTTARTITANTWNHVAVVWTGSVMRMFINGILDSTSSTTAMTTQVDSLCLMGYSNYAPDPQWMNGYINDFRLTKGYARYLANFTPPTSLLQIQ